MQRRISRDFTLSPKPLLYQLIVQALKNRFDQNLLETITDPVATIFVMITVKILSAHSTDEEYLDKDVHNYIKVSPRP